MTSTPLDTETAPDVRDLDGSITDLAGLLGRLGDDRHLDVRRASALGMPAHPQRALGLAGTEPEVEFS